MSRKTIAEREAERACRDFKRPEWDSYTDTEFAWFIRVAINRALAAERRRIRKAIRADMTWAESLRDSHAAHAKEGDEAAAYSRDHCNGVAAGLKRALKRVTPRQVRAMTAKEPR